MRALGAEPVDFSLSRTGMNPLRDLADMVRLALILRRQKPDMTFAYFTKPIIYGTLAAWMARVPRRFAMIEGLGYAFTPSEGVLSLKLCMLWGVIIQLYTTALKQTERVFFLNNDDLKDFSNCQIISTNKAILLGGIGVDLDKWTPAPPVTKPVTFLLVARLLRDKGIQEYAKAAQLIKGRYHDTRFILLGSFDTHPGALSRREIEKWVAEGFLEWIEHVPDVRLWLAQASVFVLPSCYREGVPRSIQEAMAMARPVITTEAPGCRETVIHGKNGFLVPIRSAEALAAAMEQFIHQPELIDRMGQASRSMAEERFDVHKINHIILREMGIVA
ncbi:Glycosyltransferase Gtf1 [uncultured archaeon]|nr:Glycosyltransferase Gtf1 [uncultured archaeon]